jgi:SAM-dependent methyltransferase
MDLRASLDADGGQWEVFAQEDPLWAILTDPSRRGGGWDWEAFASVDRLSPAPARGEALDFGCGVGRLTLPLATRYGRVTGLDVSPTMVRLATERCPDPSRVSFVASPGPALPFADATFDLVHSHLVLQHIHHEGVRAYLAEFCRVLKPGGVTFFSLPSRIGKGPGVVRTRTEVGLGERTAVMAMLAMPPSEVAGVLEAGGLVLERFEAETTSPVLDQGYYTARKPA